MINPYELLKSGKSLDDINKLICDELTAAQQKIDVEKAEELKKAAAAKKAEEEKKVREVIVKNVKEDAVSAVHRYFKLTDKDTLWTKESVEKILDYCANLGSILKDVDIKVINSKSDSLLNLFRSLGKWF